MTALAEKGEDDDIGDFILKRVCKILGDPLQTI